MDVKPPRKKPPGRWKKGESGNLSGRPKIPEEIKNVMRMTHRELAVKIDNYMHLTADELQRVWADPQTLAIDRIIIKIVEKALKTGGLSEVGFLMERTAGKVADNLNVDAKVQTSFRDELETIIKSRTVPNGTGN